jgi:hypothetical protein
MKRDDFIQFFAMCDSIKIKSWHLWAFATIHPETIRQRIGLVLLRTQKAKTLTNPLINVGALVRWKSRATSVCGLKLLVCVALSYKCAQP